jgi:hypothetical protein
MDRHSSLLRSFPKRFYDIGPLSNICFSTVRTLPFEWNPVRCSTWVGSSFTCKYIRIGWKGVGTDKLDYNAVLSNTTLKGFIEQAPVKQ